MAQDIEDGAQGVNPPADGPAEERRLESAAKNSRPERQISRKMYA